MNVHRTVRDLANLGVAALTIEDQQFPKKCALTKEVKILDFNDACQRIKVAVNAGNPLPTSGYRRVKGSRQSAQLAQ